MSILEEIYNGKYNPWMDEATTPQNVREKDIAFWKKAAEALGLETVDEHLYRLCESENADDVHNFRKGFQLGVLLMLEVFGIEAK